jgi:hypothetical protein
MANTRNLYLRLHDSIEDQEVHRLAGLAGLLKSVCPTSSLRIAPNQYHEQQQTVYRE